MSNVTVAGRLGRDPELKFTANGNSVVNFSVAESHGEDKPAVWIDVTAWGQLAENVAASLTKGQYVTILGYLGTRETKVFFLDSDGEPREDPSEIVRLHVVANDVLLGLKFQELEATPNERDNQPRTRRAKSDEDEPEAEKPARRTRRAKSDEGESEAEKPARRTRAAAKPTEDDDEGF